jgi:hypothetical protein
VLAESNGLALDDLLPTEQWPVGQEVIDRVRLDSPAEVARAVRLRWVDQAGVGDTFEAAIGEYP